MRTKKDRSALLAAIGAGVLVGLLFLSYLLSSGALHRRDTGIVLDTGAGSSPVVSPGSQLLTVQSVADVAIGTDNARQVIATLTRPTAYTCTVENTLYHAGGASALRCRRYAAGDVVRTDTLGTFGTVQSTLLRAGETIYAWNAGDSTAYTGKRGAFTDDAAAMLPTYEDVLDEDIVLLRAGRQDVEQEPCVMVEFEQGGYRCIYHVSAVSGLLRSAAFYQGDTLARQVMVNDLQTDMPAEELFRLPDGKTVLGER